MHQKSLIPEIKSFDENVKMIGANLSLEFNKKDQNLVISDLGKKIIRFTWSVRIYTKFPGFVWIIGQKAQKYKNKNWTLINITYLKF